MNRKEVYTVIDGERDYQDSKWGGRNHDQIHEIEAWIMYMEHYIDQAKAILSTESYVTANTKAMGELRKAIALGIACMENYETPRR
jgi:hypothetical protein